MARILTLDQKTGLTDEDVFSTMAIHLASGASLYLATADLLIGSQVYLGTMKMTAPLRMGLTRKTDKVTFEILNIDLVLGQELIIDETIFDNSLAIFGAYHHSLVNSGVWHDEKIPGEIHHSEIDGNSIYCEFMSETDAAEYQGKKIADIFTGLPAREDVNVLPGPIDLITDPGIGRGRLPIFMDDPFFGRHYLPQERNIY